MKVLAAVTFVACLAFAGASSAATYAFNFTDTSNTFTASGLLTTSNTLNAVNGYDVTAISGTVTGNPAVDFITGLVPNPNQPNPTNNGAFIYDNVLFTPGQALDVNGLLFNTSAGVYNLWMNSSRDAELYTYGAPGALDVHGALTITAVPEPMTWAMILIGFGGLGLALRSRRRLAPATA